MSGLALRLKVTAKSRGQLGLVLLILGHRALGDELPKKAGYPV